MLAHVRVTRIGVGGRRRHLAVTWGKSGWFLQWANPTLHGFSFEKPIAGPFKTRREAVRERKEIKL